MAEVPGCQQPATVPVPPGPCAPQARQVPPRRRSPTWAWQLARGCDSGGGAFPGQPPSVAALHLPRRPGALHHGEQPPGCLRLRVCCLRLRVCSPIATGLAKGTVGSSPPSVDIGSAIGY